MRNREVFFLISWVFCGDSEKLISIRQLLIVLRLIILTRQEESLVISQTLPYQWSEEKIPANNYTHLVFPNRRIRRKPGSGKVLSHLLSNPITHGSIGERVEDFNDGGGWWWSFFGLSNLWRASEPEKRVLIQKVMGEGFV